MNPSWSLDDTVRLRAPSAWGYTEEDGLARLQVSTECDFIEWALDAAQLRALRDCCDALLNGPPPRAVRAGDWVRVEHYDKGSAGPPRITYERWGVPGGGK